MNVDRIAALASELFPMPYVLIVSVLCLVLGFVYGYRHPEGF